jgi:hypothetical protein
MGTGKQTYGLIFQESHHRDVLIFATKDGPGYLLLFSVKEVHAKHLNEKKTGNCIF